MSTYPSAATIKVLGDGRAVQVRITRAKSIYARAGIIAITPGQIDIPVLFTTPLPSTNYVLGALTIVNQAAPDPFLQVRGVSILSQTGFTVSLAAPAPSGTYKLHWSIGELYNP